MSIKKSCAFNDAPIEILNNKAQTIDRRLFLFAYYSPKAFPETESTLVQFYSAVINLYGLFWDCSLFVKNNLFQKRNCDGLLERDNYGNITANGNIIRNKINKLLNYLSGLRNTAFHNNALEYYYNQINTEHAHDFFLTLNLKFNNLCPDDWKKCLNELCRQADEVIKGAEYCLNWLNKLPEIRKKKIINYWLETSICKWYINKKSEFNGYFEELKQLHSAKFHKPYIKLPDWLQTNFGISDNSKWLEETHLLNLLNDINKCPTPALPVPVFRILADEVYNFAMTDKNK